MKHLGQNGFGVQNFNLEDGTICWLLVVITVCSLVTTVPLCIHEGLHHHESLMNPHVKGILLVFRNNLSAAEFRRVEIAQCTFDTSLTALLSLVQNLSD